MSTRNKNTKKTRTALDTARRRVSRALSTATEAADDIKRASFFDGNAFRSIIRDLTQVERSLARYATREEQQKGGAR
jgi:hypothetical protein